VCSPLTNVFLQLTISAVDAAKVTTMVRISVTGNLTVAVRITDKNDAHSNIPVVILTNCLCGSLMYATVGRRWFTAFVKHTVSLIISVEFFGCSMQLQQHDSVHLSSAYTDYSFSSYGRPYVVIGRPYYFTPVISSFFLLSFFLQLFSAVADWMSTIHDVALVRI